MSFAGLVKLALGRLRNRVTLTLAVSLSVAMVIALTTAIPQFANGVGKLTVQDELSRSYQLTSSPPFAVRCYSGMGAGKALTLEEAEYAWRWIGDLLEREVGLPIATAYGQSESLTFDLRGRPDDERYKGKLLAPVRMTTVTNIGEHVQMVAGLPIGQSSFADGMAVWVERAFAEKWLLTDGDILHLSDSGMTPLPIQIAGIWEASDLADDFWFRDPKVQFADYLLTTPEQYQRFIAPLNATQTSMNTWYYTLDERRMNLRYAERYIEGLERVRIELAKRLPSGAMDISPLDELRRGRDRASALSAILFGFSMPLLVLLVYFTSALSAMATRFQTQELATLSSRGMSPRQVFSLLLAEAGLILLVACPVGVTVGLTLAQLLGNTRGFMTFGFANDLPVSLYTVDWWLVILAALISLAARILPSWNVVRLTIVTYEQRRSRPEVWLSPSRLVLAILIALTAFAYQRVGLTAHGATMWYPGADPRNDLLRVLAPALFMLTGALLGAELLGLLMKPLARLAAILRSPATYLGCLTLSRESGRYRTPTFMLVLALCTGIFYASLAKSADSWMMDRLRYSVGSDLTFQQLTSAEIKMQEGRIGSGAIYTLDPSWSLPISEYQKIEGVAQAARVGDYDARIELPGTVGGVRFLAVDRFDLPKVLYFRDDYAEQPLGELLNGLALHQEGVLVPSELLQQLQLREGEELPLSLTLDDAQFTARFKIVGSFDYFPTMYAEDRYILIGNLDYLETETGGFFPFGVWIQLQENADPKQILDHVRDMDVRIKDARDLTGMVRADEQSLERVGIFGGLSIYFLGGAFLATVGQLIYILFAIVSQSVAMAILRAMGLRRTEVVRLVGVQFFLSLAYGLVAGIALGILVSRLFIPYLPLTTSGQVAVPPFVPMVDWRSAIQITAILGAAQLVLGGMSAMRVVRARLFEQLRLGEKH